MHAQFITCSYFLTVGFFILLVVYDPITYLIDDPLPTYLIGILSVAFVVSHLNPGVLLVLRDALRMVLGLAAGAG